jgi:hypothetical protein
MKVCTPIILVVTLLVSCGKSTITEQINIAKSDKHIKIAGTNVYVIPPAGFGPTATAEELVDFSTAARISISQQATPFSSSNDVQEVNDSTTRKDIRVNQYEGIYVSTWVNETFLKEALSFGNDNVTVRVAATIPTADTVVINKVRLALRSVVLVDEKIPDPSDDAAFKVDISKTNLKFTRLINGMLIYTESGSMLGESNFSFVVAFSYGMTATPERYEAVAEEYLRTEIYYNDIRIRSSVAVTIDGKPGYAITAEGTQTDTHTKDLIYLVVLYKNDGAYVMLGTASKDVEDNLKMFTQVAGTFYVKDQK